MPKDGSPLFIIVPVYVDDGFTVMNSTSLYQWFIKHLLADLEVVDMGPVVMYLGNRITHDRTTCTLWISQRPLLVELLQTWNMLDCTPTNMPLSQPLHKLPTPPPNSLPDICDADIKLNFQ